MREQPIRAHSNLSTAVAESHRAFMRDAKPYELIGQLDRLRGPVDGTVALPSSVWWAPGDGRVNLDEPGGFHLVYRAVLSEGTVDDQERFVNRDVLLRIWPELMLPRRVRALWEAEFPELVRPTA